MISVVMGSAAIECYKGRYHTLSGHGNGFNFRFADDSGVVNVGITHTQEVPDTWEELRLPSIAAWQRGVNPPPQLDIRVLLVPAGCFFVSMADPA
jgi:hypothetical protein